MKMSEIIVIAIFAYLYRDGIVAFFRCYWDMMEDKEL